MVVAERIIQVCTQSSRSFDPCPSTWDLGCAFGDPFLQSGAFSLRPGDE